jgi:predicted nucleic acid-binding protein
LPIRASIHAVDEVEISTAPSLLPFEADNSIRRHELAEVISADQTAQAHCDLIDLAIEHGPYELLLPRAWQLRHNLTTYDASYVAPAELLEATLVTLDLRIGRPPGVRCTVARRKPIVRGTRAGWLPTSADGPTDVAPFGEATSSVLAGAQP